MGAILWAGLTITLHSRVKKLALRFLRLESKAFTLYRIEQPRFILHIATDRSTMPLAVRYVEPQRFTSMPLLEVATSNHLRALNVQNLTGVMRQLSSLAKHAESIMGDIADVLYSYNQRSVALEERTRRLKDEILPSLDPEEDCEEMFSLWMCCLLSLDSRVEVLYCLYESTCV